VEDVKRHGIGGIEKLRREEQCNTCGGKNTVIWKVKWNEKGEIFCPPYRTGKKMLWWNWGREVEWIVPRVQKGRARITNPRRVVGTVNQKAVQKKGEAREVYND